MQIIDVVKQEVHGGTVRIFIKKDAGKYKVKKSVQNFIDKEVEDGLDDVNTYLRFADNK